MLNRITLPLLTIITLASAVLRFYDINAIPPGLHYDIAANAILVEDIAFKGFRPVFISAYTGKEVLFFYSAAAIFKMIGSSIFALKFTAAIWGIITIPITFFAIRQVLKHHRHSHFIAITVATFVAFSFTHLVWSRFGLRAITQPAIQALAIGLLFRALRHNKSRDFLLSGLLLGLTFHTYLAARVLPLALLISCLPIAISYFNKSIRKQWRLPLRGDLVQFVLGLLIVIMPLILHFYQHPQEFLTRINQVGPIAGETDLITKGIIGALGMLFVSGEPYDRFNIPDKTLFDPITASLFLLGLLITIWKLSISRKSKSTSNPINTAAMLLLVVWLPVFLLPTALAVHEVFPSNVRAFGLFPFIFVFPAIGLLSLLSPLVSRYNTDQQKSSIYMFAIAIIFTLTCATTVKDYFHIWAKQETQYIVNDGDIMHAAKYINSKEGNYENTYVSAIHHQHPTMAYLANRYEDIMWLRGGETLVIPSIGPILYVFPQSALPPADWISSWESALVASPADTSGNLDLLAYHFNTSTDIPQLEFQSVYAKFGQVAEITGFRIPKLQTEGHLNVDLRIKILNSDKSDYRFVADLVDRWGYHWSQGFNDSFQSTQWQSGDTIIVRTQIPRRTGMPPGQYNLAVTIYSPSSNLALSSTSHDGKVSSTAQIGPIQVAPSTRTDELPIPQHDRSDTFGNLELFGYDLSQHVYKPGAILPLSLYWRSINPTSQNQNVILMLDEHIIDSSEPAKGTYPTSKWTPGEIVIDHRYIRIPRETTPGKYNLGIKSSLDNDAIDKVILMPIEIEKINREWKATIQENRTEHTIGNVFQLVGYNTRFDQQFSIQLNWKSLQLTNIDYTVFVHAFNSDNILIGQSDSQPVNNTYPTSLWVPNEHVVDTHYISLNPGEYDIKIGLYLPETGDRLTLNNGTDAIIIENLIVP